VTSFKSDDQTDRNSGFLQKWTYLRKRNKRLERPGSGGGQYQSEIHKLLEQGRPDEAVIKEKAVSGEDGSTLEGAVTQPPDVSTREKQIFEYGWGYDVGIQL